MINPLTYRKWSFSKRSPT